MDQNLNFVIYFNNVILNSLAIIVNKEHSNYIYKTYLIEFDKKKLLKNKSIEKDRERYDLDINNDASLYIIFELLSISFIKNLTFSLNIHKNFDFEFFKKVLSNIKDLSFLNLRCKNSSIKSYLDLGSILPESLNYLKGLEITSFDINNNLKGRFPNLKVLNMCDCNYKAHEMVFNLDQLTKLTLESVKGINWKDFYENLKNTSLKSLNLYYDSEKKLDNTNVQYIGHIIKESKLSNLSLENVSFTFEDLTNSDLKTINLENCKIKNLVDFIKLNSNLKILKLYYMKIPPKLLEFVTNLNYLEELLLMKNEIDEDNSNDILNLIKKNTSIKSLIISNENLTFKQGELSKALNENTTLNNLKLPTWDIDYSFFNKNLEILTIYYYQFNLKDLKIFLNQIKESKLKKLTIDRETNDSFEIYKEFINSNPKLEYLQVFIPHEEFKDNFFECLYSNTNLKSLYILNYEIKLSNIMIIHNLFLYNYTLQNMLIYQNYKNIIKDYLLRNKNNEIISKFKILSIIKAYDIQFHFKD